ncbi:MAG: DbpA RNA binding domain-containing protein, partial [Flavobacteriales bacterium]|nr:DbpA RNA binding domain-containing protein [Flavobacteriales bacterium]
ALLPIAHEQLAEFSKEQLIERFMSVAFDRLLGQFGALPDLNIDLSAKDHTLRNDRPSSRERFTTGRQLFINLGREHGFDKGKMLGYICGISGLSGDMIGRMYIDQYHAFIDIEPDHFQQVFNSLKGANYQGRKVRVDEGRGQQDRGDRPRQDRGDRPQHRKGPRSFDKGPKKPHRKGPKSGGRRFD